MAFRQLVKRLPVWTKVVVVLIVLLAVGIVGANIYLSRLVNGKLRQMVADASHGLYQLNYSGVNVNVLTCSLVLHEVSLEPDKNAVEQLRHLQNGPRFLVGGKTPKLSLKNVGWLSYLRSKKLGIGKILLKDPEFNVIQYHRDSATQSVNTNDLLSKQVKDLRIGMFSMDNAVIVYQVADTAAQARTVNKIEHLNIGFSKIHLDENKRLQAEDYHIQLKEFRHRTADSMYWIGISGFDYNSKKKQLNLASFYVQPMYPEEELSKKLTEQETVYKMYLRNIVARGFDLNVLLEQGRAIVPELQVNKGTIDIYMDRALPKPGADQVNVAISQKLMHLGTPFDIRVLKLENILLKYREQQVITDRVAEIVFENVKGQGTNITNIPAMIKKDPLMKVSIDGSFLSSGINARFEFDLADPNGKFTTWFRGNQLDASRLNPILESTAKIEARRGTLRQLEATVQGNADHATANVNMQYQGLKINMLKLEGDSLIKKGLPSMFANILIEDDNPKDGILRAAKGVTIRRGMGRSFFNMLWLSVSTGIQQIITKKKGLKLG